MGHRTFQDDGNTGELSVGNGGRINDFKPRPRPRVCPAPRALEAKGAWRGRPGPRGPVVPQTHTELHAAEAGRPPASRVDSRPRIGARASRGEGDPHDGGLPGAIGPQQGRDLVSVEGEGQVSDGCPVRLVLLGHRHQGDARGSSVLLPCPVLR